MPSSKGMSSTTLRISTRLQGEGHPDRLRRLHVGLGCLDSESLSVVVRELNSSRVRLQGPA